jgi:hypothetical protein
MTPFCGEISDDMARSRPPAVKASGIRLIAGEQGPLLPPHKPIPRDRRANDPSLPRAVK